MLSPIDLTWPQCSSMEMGVEGIPVLLNWGTQDPLKREMAGLTVGVSLNLKCGVLLCFSLFFFFVFGLDSNHQFRVNSVLFIDIIMCYSWITLCSSPLSNINQ